MLSLCLKGGLHTFYSLKRVTIKMQSDNVWKSTLHQKYFQLFINPYCFNNFFKKMHFSHNCPKPIYVVACCYYNVQ